MARKCFWNVFLPARPFLYKTTCYVTCPLRQSACFWAAVCSQHIFRLASYSFSDFSTLIGGVGRSLTADGKWKIYELNYVKVYLRWKASTLSSVPLTLRVWKYLLLRSLSFNANNILAYIQVLYKLIWCWTYSYCIYISTLGVNKGRLKRNAASHSTKILYCWQHSVVKSESSHLHATLLLSPK